VGVLMTGMGQTRTSSLGAARPLPPTADIGPGGQSENFCVRLGDSCKRTRPPEAEWARQEADFYTAQREGRVLGGFDVSGKGGRPPNFGLGLVTSA
jgi:hypothetical protein